MESIRLEDPKTASTILSKAVRFEKKIQKILVGIGNAAMFRLQTLLYGPRTHPLTAKDNVAHRKSVTHRGAVAMRLASDTSSLNQIVGGVAECCRDSSALRVGRMEAYRAVCLGHLLLLAWNM